MAREFKGETGTIYVQYSEGDYKPYNVWFEDFVILGDGDSEIEALRDARAHTANIGKLITDAIGELSDATPATQAVGGSGGE